MNSFGELVTLHVRQLTKNLLSLFFGTLCCLFADVLVNSCHCYHGRGIFVHFLEDLKSYMPVAGNIVGALYHKL